MAKVETVTIESKTTASGQLVINRDDFDPKQHKEVAARPAADGDKGKQAGRQRKQADGDKGQQDG